MRKNAAGQRISANLKNAADGQAFAGTVTVYVTGDGGAQTAGAGTVTSKGQGSFSYAPTQAETNYNHVEFLFTGAGAVSREINVYPRASVDQTGDAFARLGAPTGASFSADLAAMRGAGFNTATDSLEALRDRGDAAWTTGSGGGSGGLDAAGIRAAVGLESANLGTLLGGISVAIGTLPNWTAISGAFSALQDHGDSNWAGGGSGGDSAATIAEAVRAELSLTGSLDAKFTTLATAANVTSAQSTITSAISSSQTAVINAIPTATGVVNEWKSQSQADPTQFHVNVKEMNDAAVVGNGTEGNKWRGA